MKTNDNKLTTDNGQKQAEPVMQASLQLLPLIMNNIPQAVFWKDRDLVYLGCNQAFAEDTGFSSPEEIIGKTDFDMPWKEQAELYRADDRLVMEKGEPKLNYEEPQTAPNGSTIWLSTSKIPVYENGRVVAVLGMYEDVTARKQAEASLQESEDRFRRFADATIEGVVFHEQGKIVDVNPAILAILGLSDPAELIGRQLLEFVVPEFHELVLQKMQSESVLPYEIQCVRKDGTTFPIETSTRAYRAGEHTLRATTVRDVTQRKQAEEAVRASEDRFRRFTEATVEGLVFHEQGKVVDVNPAVGNIFGYSDGKELIGRNLLEFIAPEFHQLVLKQMQSETVLPYEIQGIRKNGITFPIETSTRAYKEGERIIRASSIRDITERKQSEAEVQQEKLFSDAVINGLPGIFFLFDMQGKMVRWNKDYERVLGYTTEETAARNAVDPIADDDKEKTAAAIQRAFTEGRGSVEANLVTKNGERIPTYFVAQRLQLGGQLYLAGTGIDITDRKFAEAQVERALGETRMRYEVSQVLAGAQTEDEVLDVLEQHAGIYPEATVQLYSFDRQEADVAVILRRENAFESGIASTLPVGTRFPASQFTLLNLISADKPFVSNDFFTDERADPTSRQMAQQGGATSIAAFPLTVSGELMGIIIVTAKPAGYFDETKQHLYQTLAELGAAALQTARLRDQIQSAMTRRGYQVQISTEISQEVAAASELNDLFERVVTLTKERLGYYHTQLLRYSPTQDAVVLIAGYGETGQKMLAGGHQMPMGAGLIGSAAASGETVLRSTLAEDPDWHPNPLLPDTQGEIAVPIKWQNTVLGVLDVQSDRAGALTEDDRLLLEGLCGQVAVAIEQTRMRQEMAERLEEVNRLYQSMSHEGWQTYRQTADLPAGFVYDQAGIRPLGEDVLADELFANIPMRVLGGEVVGTLAIANDPQHPTSPDDYSFLQQVSDQIALALESARLFEQTQSALAQSEKLFEASRNIAQATDLRELLKATVETLNIPVIDRAGLEIFSYNAAGELDRMTLAATWGPAWTNRTRREEETVGRSFTADMLKMMPLFLSPTPMFFNDLYHDERVDSASIQVAKKQNYRALATLPLFVGTQQVGVVTLTAEEPHNFTQDEIRLFSAMAPQITTVLENRRQFERAQKQAERESTLNIISQKIQGATSVEAVLQIAARELGHALGAPRTIAQLSIKDKK